ncbi:MAG: glyoxylase family protein [Frankiaceae bacterium]|nr:glyoxylase family protein [Frankiaceae bacterium]
MPDFTGVSHVGLSVTDLDRSVAWYTDVLGFVLVMPTDAPGLRRMLLAHPGSGLMVGLSQHEAGTGTAFDERATGLDHLSLAVNDREELVRWAEHLAAKGVTASPIEDAFYGNVLVLRDPDNIQLELFVRAG